MNSEYEGLLDVAAIGATTWGADETLPPVAESWRRLFGTNDVRAAGRVAMRGLSFMVDTIMATRSPGVHTNSNPRVTSEAPVHYRGRHEADSMVVRQRSDVVAAAEAIVVAAEQSAQSWAAHQNTFANV